MSGPSPAEREKAGDPFGRVVASPRPRHQCSPGWTDGGPGLVSGWREAIPPDTCRHPRGTVWRCNCGRHWVSKGARGWPFDPGTPVFRPERRLERRRRLRRERAS